VLLVRVVRKAKGVAHILDTLTFNAEQASSSFQARSSSQGSHWLTAKPSQKDTHRSDVYQAFELGDF
jgi:hypothetical protein